IMKRRNFIAMSSLVALGPKMMDLEKPKVDGFVVRKGKARHDKHLPYRGINVNDLKISKNDTNGNLALLEYIGEYFFIMEGSYRFRLDQEEFVLEAGDSIFLPRMIPHTWLQLSDYGRIIYLVTPAGSFEDFFEEGLAFKAPPSEEQINALHKKHQMKIVGPPLML
ncbi:MAG TPA: cupin domain-containing protein, partial [Saprospiraceae bacterium]|nr:cupin domain-containing protein [Saprospiraceae bacterium]